METFTAILPILVFLALIWFTYTNISYAVTIYRAKKKDHTLSLCLSDTGKYFYIGALIAYLILFIACVTLMVMALFNDINNLYAPLNILTLGTIFFVFFFQKIIFIGHRQMMIGRVQLDYRKIKRVTYPKETKLKFVYGQKTFQTSIRFADDFKLKKALQKTR
mgnify:CR=1 FL=1